MFRAEAVFRKEFKKERDSAVEKMTMYQKVHDKLTKDREDLNNEVERKERLAR